MKRVISIIIFLLLYSLTFSADRVIFSGFSSKDLDTNTIDAIDNAFVSELIDSQLFDIVDRKSLETKLLQELDKSGDYSEKNINSILSNLSKSNLSISGEVIKLRDRFTITVVMSDITTNTSLSSIEEHYTTTKSYLPFYTKKVAEKFVNIIENNSKKSYPKKYLYTDMIDIKSGYLYSEDGSKEWISGFKADLYEVTNLMFEQFVNETGYVTDCEKIGYGWLYIDGSWEKTKGVDWKHPTGPISTLKGLDDYPVIHVSYNDAQAFCKWAEKRLLTENEWKYIAQKKTFTKYPYGKFYNELAGNFNTSDNGWVTKKGIFPKEGKGLYDLSGNVSEWTSSEIEIEGQKFRVIKGGNWLSGKKETEIDNIDYQKDNAFYPYIGFRCIK